MKVDEVMRREVVTVRAGTPFKEIAQAMLRHGVSGVPVVDVTGTVVGVVTDSDLLAKEAYPHREKRALARLADMFAGEPEGERKAGGLYAEDVMSTPAISIGPAETIRGAARIMIERGIKRLPVVEGGRLVGLISRHDVLRVFARADGDLRGMVEAFLRQCLYVPPEHVIEVSVDGGIVRLDGVVQFESDARIAAALVGSLDGVVSVESRLSHRAEDPRPSSLRTIPRAAHVG